jgi:hypothetical protein
MRKTNPNSGITFSELTILFSHSHSDIVSLVQKRHIYCATSHPHNDKQKNWSSLLHLHCTPNTWTESNLVISLGHRFSHEFHGKVIVQSRTIYTGLNGCTWTIHTVSLLQQLLITCNWLEVQDMFIRFKQRVSNRIIDYSNCLAWSWRWRVTNARTLFTADGTRYIEIKHRPAAYAQNEPNWWQTCTMSAADSVQVDGEEAEEGVC